METGSRRVDDRRPGCQGVEVALDRRAQPRPVVVGERSSCVDVGEERLTSGTEIEDLGLEALALSFGDPAGVRLGLADHATGVGVGLVGDASGLGLGLGHRFVGGPLGEHQGPAEHVFGLAARRVAVAAAWAAA